MQRCKDIGLLSVVTTAFATSSLPLHLLESESIIDQGVLVVAMVADNEAVNGALYRLLKNDFPFLIHVPCAAHTVQLCVKKIIDLPQVGMLLAP